MEIERIIEILEKHQEWRRDQNVPPKTEMQSPIEIGTAIDYALSELKKLRLGDVGRSFSEKEVKAFVIKLRKKHRAIEEKQFFCNDHNFKIEAEAKRSEAEVVRRIIHEMENEFDLGFVWDDSLND